MVCCFFFFFFFQAEDGIRDLTVTGVQTCALPILVTRMSGSGHAASAAMRPCSLVMSAATVTTVAPVAARISSAGFSPVWGPPAAQGARPPSPPGGGAPPPPRALPSPPPSAALPPTFRTTIHLPD